MAFSIKIPTNLLPSSVKFKEGEKVDWGKKNLKEKSEEEHTIQVAEELEIEPKDIFKHIKVDLGQTIAKDEIIAEKKGLLSANKLISPVHGEIRGIDHLEGTVTLNCETTTEVPFALQAQFIKKDKSDYLFTAKEGIEYEVNFALDNTFGGFCAYLNKMDLVKLSECENKVVINESGTLVDSAKIAALDPIALVAYQSEYHQTGTTQLLLKNKSDWQDLLKKKWPLCLYLQGGKTIYFYKN